MNKLFKKLLLSILTGVILIFSLVPGALAQGQPSLNGGSGNQVTQQQVSNQQSSTTQATPGPWYNQNYIQWSQKVFDTSNPNEIFGERYTYAQVNWIINSLTAVIIGSNVSACFSSQNVADLGNCMQKLVVNAQKACPSCTSNNTGGGSAVLGLANLTNIFLTTKPASGIDYVKGNLARLHVISPAYAQTTGVGFNTLNPVVSLWTVVRDICYFLLIIVIIAMAFLIMFRVKISPQTVVSVQSFLPKLVFALILITFSYAIAGFLVDLSYVFLGAFAVMIKGIGGSSLVLDKINGPVGLFNQLNSGNGLVSILLSLILIGIPALLGSLVAGGVVSTITPVAIFTGATGVLGAAWTIAGGIFIAAILLLIIAIVFLVILIRLFILMLRTALTTVLLIVFSPFMILMGTVSQSFGFGRWIRQLIGNLAVYPTVSIMIFLSHYFFWGWFLGGASAVNCSESTVCVFDPFNTYMIRGTGTGATLPGVINFPGFPIGTNLIGLVFSFAILFLIPHTAHVIEAIIEGKGFDYQSAIGKTTKIPGTAGQIESFARRVDLAHPWVGAGVRLVGNIFGG